MMDQHDDAPEKGAQDTGLRGETTSAASSGDSGTTQNNAASQGALGEDGQPKKRGRSRGSRGRGRGRSKKNREGGEAPQPGEQSGASSGAQPGAQVSKQPAQQPARQQQPQARQQQSQQPAPRQQQPQRPSGGSPQRERGNTAPPRRPVRSAGNPNFAAGNILDPLHEMTEEELEAADRAALAKANALADAGLVPSPVAGLGGPRGARPQSNQRQPRPDARPQRSDARQQGNQNQGNQKQGNQKQGSPRQGNSRQDNPRQDNPRQGNQPRNPSGTQPGNQQAQRQPQRQNDRPARPPRPEHSAPRPEQVAPRPGIAAAPMSEFEIYGLPEVPIEMVAQAPASAAAEASIPLPPDSGPVGAPDVAPEGAPDVAPESTPDAKPAPKPRTRGGAKTAKAPAKAAKAPARAAKTPAKAAESKAAPTAEPVAESRPENRVESRADAEIVESAGKKGRQKMFIGVLPGELVEVVLTEEGGVQEYYVEMLHQAKTKGNIYKGYIHNVDSALQAAFINYGAERNGFLQIDEVHPEYYLGSYPLKKGARFPLIQKVLRAGQEVLVQVVKEPTGKKGAFLSSYLSLPGRYFVYTLGRDQQGVSRKIEDEKERERLKGLIDAIGPQEGVGLIVRTAGIGRAKTELMRDYKYLHRIWGDIKKKAQTEKAPSLVYKELELAVRAARDYLTQDVSEVWVDDPETFEQIKEYVAMAFPKSPNMVKLHADHDKTLWERFGLSRQVEQIYSREVTLPSGGRLVFDHTEALTSVDINSGKIGGEQSFAKMAHKTNMEAAEEISRQLKLRDIGGQIVIDFIEMKDVKHLREVEKTMRQALKYDRARTDVSTISPFGLMELVRQRLGSSAISVSTEPCPCCGGTGIRRNLEWQALQTMKSIHQKLRRPGCPNPLQVPLGQELAIYMLNNKRELLMEMGAKLDTRVEIIVDTKLP